MSSEDLKQIFKYIDTNADKFVERLGEAVAFKSVSANPDYRDEVIKAIQWTQKLLQEQGAQTELVEVGQQNLPDGSVIPYPPVLLGQIGTDSNKRTVCIYGHLDVQPALYEDGWDTDPFVLAEKDGKLYGRGASDNKGPVMGWINAIEAYNQSQVQFPVNLKFVFEGMEESSSVGLADIIKERRNTFMEDVDYVCMCDGLWLGERKPCLSYGLRGYGQFCIEIECAARDLHSGVYGGAVHEGMSDLMKLMSRLVGRKGTILINGIMEDVSPMAAEEEKLYKDVDFSTEEFGAQIGVTQLVHTSKFSTLTHRWRYPSLSLHGIEGAFSGPGSKTVIPRKVIGKFSIRLVPNQQPDKIEKQVIDFVQQEFTTLNSPNKCKCYSMGQCAPWIADINNPNYTAAKMAVKEVYGLDPDFIREGATIPVAMTFQEVTGNDVLLLPIGAADDGFHSQNEKINRWNYIEGTKLFAAYIAHLAKV